MIHFCSENFYVFLLTNVLKALMKYEIEKNTDEEFYKKVQLVVAHLIIII